MPIPLITLQHVKFYFPMKNPQGNITNMNFERINIYLFVNKPLNQNGEQLLKPFKETLLKLPEKI